VQSGGAVRRRNKELHKAVISLHSALISGHGAGRRGPASVNFEIVTLSNRADLISGGDALVEVRVPKGVALTRCGCR